MLYVLGTISEPLSVIWEIFGASVISHSGGITIGGLLKFLPRFLYWSHWLAGTMAPYRTYMSRHVLSSINGERATVQDFVFLFRCRLMVLRMDSPMCRQLLSNGLETAGNICRRPRQGRGSVVSALWCTCCPCIYIFIEFDSVVENAHEDKVDSECMPVNISWARGSATSCAS